MANRLAQDSKATLHIAVASRTATTPIGGTNALVGPSGHAFRAAIFTGAAAANTTLDAKAQHSDDGTNFTDITGAAIVQITAADTLAVLDFRASKKYARILATPGGAGIASGITFGVILDAYQQPSTPVTHTPAAVVT